MGWWRIDPATGKPAEDAPSKLSRPPEFTLLNAVPGVDDDDAAHYLGDAPWNTVFSHVGDIEKLIAGSARPSETEARRLFVGRVLPPSLERLPADTRRTILRVIEEMWADVDGCYDDDWERPATPAEKRWVGEYAVRRLANVSD
jgi:hypothetical protein